MRGRSFVWINALQTLVRRLDKCGLRDGELDGIPDLPSFVCRWLGSDFRRRMAQAVFSRSFSSGVAGRWVVIELRIRSC